MTARTDSAEAAGPSCVTPNPDPRDTKEFVYRECSTSSPLVVEIAREDGKGCPDCGFLACICFDDDDQPEDEYDAGEDCGRWINGRLDGSCTLAGTEFCDWDCPYSR